MLGKLMKYELQATAKTMLPIFGVMLLVSVLINATARLTNGRELPEAVRIIFVLITVLFIVGLMAIGVVTVSVMIQRFRNNLLRDEGYIMHTLPVSVHAQIWSKVLVSALWYALTGVTVVLSILLVGFDVDTLKELGDLFSDLLEIGLNARDVELAAEIMGLLLLGSVLVSLSFDAALSVGHAFAKSKMALSIVAFIALLILGNIFTYGGSNLLASREAELLSAAQQADFMTHWRVFCACAAGTMLAKGAVCYAITVFFLKRKLNLE